MKTLSIETLRDMGGEELLPFFDQALIGFTKTELTMEEIRWVFMKVSFKVLVDLHRARLQALVRLGNVKANRIVR